MVCTGDVATNWKQFREAFDDYSIATQLAEKSAEIQAATLKTIMGKECRQILLRLQLTDDEKEHKGHSRQIRSLLRANS